MKLALFSCHNDLNYGSMLQAYALVAALKKNGVDAEYLDYSTCPDPNTISRIVKRVIMAPVRFVRKVFKVQKQSDGFEFFFTTEFKKTRRAYDSFHRKFIPVSQRRYYYDTISRKLDVSAYDNYMVGSDQTWSPFLYRPRNPYFLDFCELPKKSSYAPSLGTISLPLSYINLLVEKLHSFDFLSCRELSNCKRLSELMGREVTYVLDPTLLLDPCEWDKIANPSKIEGQYILAYILGEKDTVINFAERLSEEKHLPVFFIVTRPKYLDMKYNLNGIGPEDWIGLIRNAKYVVTDSFHGSLFCINYNVNFYAFSKRDGDVNSQDNARILEFLSLLGLQSRFQDDKDNPCLLEDIVFPPVNQLIEQLREKSMKYLFGCLFE